MRDSLFTKNGDWTYTRVFDCLMERMNARERFVYLELARTAVRKTQTELINWCGNSLALQEGQRRIVLRQLAVELDMPTTTLLRVLDALQAKGLIRVFDVERGTKGGMLIHLAKPDEISDLAARRAARLKHSLDQITRQNNWENSPELKKRWNIMELSLEQLRGAVTTLAQRIIRTYPQAKGTFSGTVQSQKPKLNALEATQLDFANTPEFANADEFWKYWKMRKAAGKEGG